MVYLKYHNVKYYFYHAQIQYNYLSSFTFKKMFCQNRTQLVPHQIVCVTTFTNFHSQNKIAFVFLIIFYAKINNALHLINFVIGDKTSLSTCPAFVKAAVAIHYHNEESKFVMSKHKTCNMCLLFPSFKVKHLMRRKRVNFQSIKRKSRITLILNISHIRNYTRDVTEIILNISAYEVYFFIHIKYLPHWKLHWRCH